MLGTNGTRSASDGLRFLLSGALGVEMASAAMTNGPEIFSKIIAELHSYCERKQIGQLEEIVGRAADSVRRYEQIEARERGSFPWEE